jgi:hypothetical protein
MHFRWLDDLKDMPRLHNTSHHVAALVVRKKVVAVACNGIGSRQKGCGYSDCTIHAEKKVLKNHPMVRQALLVVVRINKQQDFLNSKPCKDCEVFLEKMIAKKILRAVYYS